MPTYQYTCTDCAEPVEAVQKFTDDPLTVCVACGGKLRKVFSPVGIVFKGSGFYRTDSRNGSGARSEAATGKQAPESAAKPGESASGGGGSADKPASAATSGDAASASSKPSSSVKEKVA